MSVSAIRRMQMLLEIHERGTIIAAADALSLTPSAVSQQIANLEKDTGTALLQRVGRRVQLTNAGLIMVDSARTILREIDRKPCRRTSRNRALGDLPIRFLCASAPRYQIPRRTCTASNSARSTDRPRDGNFTHSKPRVRHGSFRGLSAPSYPRVSRPAL